MEPVFGTDIYTDDSSVCTAAIHAGLLTSPDSGGTVAIEVRPDPSQYLGTVRHGITSEDWYDHWPSSFIFVWWVRDEGPPPAIQAHARTTVESWPESVGRRLSFFCPPKVELLSVFGTDLYTDDSPVCSAGVHAARISHERGGVVSIVLRPGQSRYPGTSRNGIPSMTAESRLQSYEFVETPSGTPLPPTLTTPYVRPDGQRARPVPVD